MCVVLVIGVISVPIFIAKANLESCTPDVYTGYVCASAPHYSWRTEALWRGGNIGLNYCISFLCGLYTRYVGGSLISPYETTGHPSPGGEYCAPLFRFVEQDVRNFASLV